MTVLFDDNYDYDDDDKDDDDVLGIDMAPFSWFIVLYNISVQVLNIWLQLEGKHIAMETGRMWQEEIGVGGGEDDLQNE